MLFSLRIPAFSRRKRSSRLRSAADLFGGNADFHRVLLSPAVPKSAKISPGRQYRGSLPVQPADQKFPDGDCGSPADGRIHRIVEAFEDAVDEHLGFERAEIIAATELTDEQKPGGGLSGSEKRQAHSPGLRD